MRRKLHSLPLPACLALLVFTGTMAAQVRFQQAYGGTELDYGFALVQTEDGGYLVAGRTESFGAGSSDAWLIRTDSLGDTLWTRTYGGPSVDAAVALAPDAGDGYFVAGYTAGAGGFADIWLLRIDAAGDTLWTRTYGGGYNDYAWSVVATEDGGCILAGETESYGAGFVDAWLIKVEEDGDTAWTRTHGGAHYDYFYSIAPAGDGGYILGGATRVSGGQDDAWLVRTDADGDTLWTRNFGVNGTDNLRAVASSGDGGFVGAGIRPGTARGHFWLVKTDGGGDTVWSRVYEKYPSTGEVGYSMARTADGGYILTGSSDAGSGDVWLVRADEDGDTLWTRSYGGSTQPDAGRSVIQTADGGFAIAGFTRSYGAGWLDVWLIKTDAQGRAAIAEPGSRPWQERLPATIVRGILRLKQGPGRLLDATGRAVLELTPGENDLSHLVPGVYFACPGACGPDQAASALKVVLTR